MELETPEQIAYTYASEANLLNQLLVLANMESYNAILIEQGKSQSERLILLRSLAIKQMYTLSGINLSTVSALLEVTYNLKKEKTKVYLYTRVSTVMQTDGYACIVDGAKINVMSAIDIMVESLKRIILDNSTEKLKLPVIIPIEDMEWITE